MTTQSQTARLTPSRLMAGRTVRPWHTLPCTTEERLGCIEAMGQRIAEYVQFMCQVGHLHGSSAESKEKAVIAFYERLLFLERELVRIGNDLQLELRP